MSTFDSNAFLGKCPECEQKNNISYLGTNLVVGKEVTVKYLCHQCGYKWLEYYYFSHTGEE